MKESEKRRANDEQIALYFGSYDHFWRLNKLLLIKSQLETPENSIETLSQYYGETYWEYDSLVRGNVAEGLMADAISEAVMHCEDYFAVLKFIRDRHNFVKHMISYNAGKVTLLAKKLANVDRETTKKLFFIPGRSFVEFNFAMGDVSEAHSANKDFEAGVKQLQEIHNDITRFYNTNVQGYNLYKHGLKLCLNKMGRTHTASEPPSSVASSPQRSPDVWRFSNSNRNVAMTTIPSYGHPNIAKHMKSLFAEGNLLQFDMNIFGQHSIESLIYRSRMITHAISTLISNRTALAAAGRDIKVCLPIVSGDRFQQRMYHFVNSSNHPIPSIDDYQLKKKL